MMNYSEVSFITEFRGECAGDYATHLEYVEDGAWEKDYFTDWLNSYRDCPYLDEIADFCNKVNDAIQIWFIGVEDGSIDPEASMK